MAASTSSTAEQPLCRLFSLGDIQSATGGFSEAHVIGRGGFGKVYKAVIDGSSSTVAVKRLASNSNQGEREFAMEMETLTKVRHRNLVSLIGYCREEGEMILVYEYITNGTLADHLYKLPANRKPLSWKQRLRICIGAGRGLDYLHSGCSIIHRDVKSTNILLDESFRAKVSDFGLAKHLGGDETVSHVSASVKGSFGYFDPSYFTTGRLTRGSDVYAFGVVLLEVLSGRSALDRWMADEGYLCMSMWAQEKIRSGKADQIVAPVFKGEISESCLKTFVGVARRCLHHEPKKRITMTRAVVQLELALEQQEKRGSGASRFLFWPFRNRTVASGSTIYKDEPEPKAEPEPEPEATPFTDKQTGVDMLSTALQVDEPPIYIRAFMVNKQTSVDTQPRALQVDEPPIYIPSFSRNITRRGLRVNHSYHSFDELTSYVSKRRGIQMKPTVDTPPIYVPAIPLAELEDIPPLYYVPTFPLAELEDITCHFSLEYMIAEGSGGERIFRAVLKSGQDVAIKHFHKKSVESDISFLEQVSKVSRLKHENMVRPLGYCWDGSTRALVYEFAPRGSLHAILHEPKTACPALSWAERIKVAAGAARGLCYIHDNDMIHHDIRSNHGFLFDNEIVKITHPHPWSPCSCEDSLFGNDEPRRGLPCSSPRPTVHKPECPWPTRSAKDDVYSFGLVLLELLTGTQLFGCSWKQQQEVVSRAKVRLFQDKVHEIVDAKFEADYPLEPVEKMAEITKLCLHYDAYSRPDMTTVSQALQIASLETHDYYL